MLSIESFFPAEIKCVDTETYQINFNTGKIIDKFVE